MFLDYKKIILFAGLTGLFACGKYLDRPTPDQAIGKGQITAGDIPL